MGQCSSTRRRRLHASHTSTTKGDMCDVEEAMVSHNTPYKSFTRSTLSGGHVIIIPEVTESSTYHSDMVEGSVAEQHLIKPAQTSPLRQPWRRRATNKAFAAKTPPSTPHTVAMTQFSCGGATTGAFQSTIPATPLDLIEEHSDDDRDTTTYSRRLVPSDEESSLECAPKASLLHRRKWSTNKVVVKPLQMPPSRLQASALAALSPCTNSNLHGSSNTCSPSAVLLGPLSPVKIKMAPCVQPQSIRVYHDTSRKSSSQVGTGSDPIVHPNRVELFESNETHALVEPEMLMNFAKLKLQVKVSEHQSKQKRVVAKLEDRVRDVTRHKHVWHQFQEIQQLQHQPAPLLSNDSATTRMSDPVITTTTAASVLSPHQFDGHGPSLRRTEQSSKAARRTKSRNEQTTASRRPRRSKTVNDSERSDSVALQESGTWLFDFQDEFRTAQTAPPKTTSGSANNSQAELSLLSSASMEVQRRLYAEKRRQRQRKKIQAAMNNGSSGMSSMVPPPPVTPHAHGVVGQDETPLVRNGHGLADMEVAFCSPEVASAAVAAAAVVDHRDNFSLVSDLDDTISFSSVVHNGHTSSSVSKSNDYGVVKRPRRPAGSRRDDHLGANDHSSCFSDDDLSSCGGSHHSRTNTAKTDEVVFDFKSVLERRLDIEARLRALHAMDDVVDDAKPAVVEPTGAFPTVESVVPVAQCNEPYTLSSVPSPLPVVNLQRGGDSELHLYRITDDGLPKSPTPRLATDGIVKRHPVVVTPPTHGWQQSANGTFKQMETSTGTPRPPAPLCRMVSDHVQTAASPPTPSHSDSGAKVTEVSFESADSHGALCLPLPYLGAHKNAAAATGVEETDSTAVGLDEISMVANQSVSSDNFVEINDESLCLYDDTDKRDNFLTMDDAHDTLRLAGQVEARVKDILNKYRRNEISEGPAISH